MQNLVGTCAWCMLLFGLWSGLGAPDIRGQGLPEPQRVVPGNSTLQVSRMTLAPVSYRGFMERRGDELPGTWKSHTLFERLRTDQQDALRSTRAVFFNDRPIGADTLLLSWPSLRPLSYRSWRAGRLVALLAYGTSEVTGHYIDPNEGPLESGTPRPVHLTYEAAPFDTHAISLLLQALPLASGSIFQVPLFDIETGQIAEETFSVTEPDTQLSGTRAYRVDRSKRGDIYYVDAASNLLLRHERPVGPPGMFLVTLREHASPVE